MIKALVENKIWIHRTEELSDEQFQRVKSVLEPPNPEKARAKREGVYNWKTLPDRLQLWHEYTSPFDGKQKLVLPRGIAHQLPAIFEEEIEWIDVRVNHFYSYPHFESILTLRPDQIETKNAIKRGEQGVIRAPTGSGKTVIMLNAIKELNQKSLVIVHKLEMLFQWSDMAKLVMGITPGTIGDGVWAESDGLTIALEQTLWARRDELSMKDWWSNFGLVCLDECHHAPASSFYKVMEFFPAKYRIGLSATPDQKTGYENLVEASIGPIIFDVSEDKLVELRVIKLPNVQVLETKFNYKFWSTHSRRKDGTCEYSYCTRKGKLHKNNYQDLINALIDDMDRNRLIADAALNAYLKGESVLVLSRRLDHLRLISSCVSLRRIVNGLMLTGEQSRESRKDIVRRANSEASIVFSTIADEALDIPRLSTVILAYPARNTKVVEQQIGRVRRIHHAKTKAPVVIDFLDRTNVLKNQFYGRVKLYRSKNMNVSYKP